jgi:acyl-coenzyme A thioesterase PaaI-like protein
MTPAELLATVPFAHRADLDVVHAEGGHVVVRIPNQPANQNHVGTVHAAALVLVGETAGGLALLNEPRLAGFMLLAKGLSIRYRKPATGACSASARITEADVDTALAALAERGKVDVPLAIELRNDAGELLAEMTVDYHLRVRTG